MSLLASSSSKSRHQPHHVFFYTDAKGYVYICAPDYSSISTVVKVATGNANGPSSTSPTLVGPVVTLTDTCNDGVVRSCWA